MERFKNILVVHEDDEAGRSTLSRAVDLATRNQAELTLIQVIGKIPTDYQMLITSLPPDEIMRMVIEERTRRLEQYAASFSRPIRVRVVAGREFLEIIRDVLRNNHDLVLKTARGMTGAMGMLFGSTAMHLLRKCPCPVWLIKPGSEQSFQRIMAAVDVVPLEFEENTLNRKIVKLAGSLTRMGNGALYIVHAWEKMDTVFSPGKLNYFSDSIETLINESRKIHTKWLNDLLDKCDLTDIKYEKHVQSGWAEEIIPQFAERNDIDLIVMGTVCRTGIPGFFIGNTAEKIVHKVNCSVLAIKPEGFETPVRLED